jgi:hypothetical protein
MRRITISLEDELYRIAKAYAMSEGISLSKAVVRLLRRGVEGPVAEKSSRVREEPSAYSYLDSSTGLLVSRGRGTITEDAVKRAEEEEDERKWNCE